MTAAALMLAAAVCATPADPAADEAYRRATAAYESGQREEAGRLLAAFRAAHPDHPLAWQAGLLWARSAADAAEAERRFADVAGGAPAATRSECELELAHLAMLLDRFGDADDRYAAWRAAHPHDERAESAAFWQAVCQAQLGRADEAAAAWLALRRSGRQPAWRAQAGLSLAGLALARGKPGEARTEALALRAASYGRDVRPQAALLAARGALALKRTGEARKLLASVVQDAPGTPEAREARTLLTGKPASVPRFGVQVGAFARRAAAATERERLTRAGSAAEVRERPHAGLTLFAVIVGPFADEAEADAARDRLQAGGASAFVVRY